MQIRSWGGGGGVLVLVVLRCVRGTKFHPGNNVGMGKDYTIFATIEGRVKFERKGRDKRQISVYPVEEAI